MNPGTGFQINSILRTGGASAATLFGVLGALSLITPDQAHDLAAQVQILNASVLTAYGALLHMWVILGPAAVIVAGYFGIKSTSAQALGAKLLKMVAHENDNAPAAISGLESVSAPRAAPVPVARAEAAIASATSAKDVLAAVVSAAPAAARVASALLVAIILGALAFPGDAFAQTNILPKPRITGDIVGDTKANLGIGQSASTSTGQSGFCDLLKLLPSCQAMPLEDIWKKILEPKIKDDLTYAKLLADNAATPGSKLRSTCYDAVLKANAQANGDAIKNPDGTPAVMPDPAVVSKLEQGAELIDNLQPTAPVMAGCAAAAQAVKVTAIQFVTGMVTLVGAKAATGGVLP